MGSAGRAGPWRRQEGLLLVPQRGGSPGGLRAEEVLTGALWWAIEIAPEMQKLKIPQVLSEAWWQPRTHQVTLGNALPSLGPESGRTFVQDLIIPERHHSKQGQSYEPPKTNHVTDSCFPVFEEGEIFKKIPPCFSLRLFVLAGTGGFPGNTPGLVATLERWWPPGGARATGLAVDPPAPGTQGCGWNCPSPPSRLWAFARAVHTSRNSLPSPRLIPTYDSGLRLLPPSRNFS